MLKKNCRFLIKTILLFKSFYHYNDFYSFDFSHSRAEANMILSLL